jgi:hypothetical protein
MFSRLEALRVAQRVLEGKYTPRPETIVVVFEAVQATFPHEDALSKFKRAMIILWILHDSPAVFLDVKDPAHRILGFVVSQPLFDEEQKEAENMAAAVAVAGNDSPYHFEEYASRKERNALKEHLMCVLNRARQFELFGV